ncbi:MAG TPA: tRNA preQ1(34) S-adenosylmethionine ribosyltransferase-isomerase QueA [Pyrinomonadaceae bacterium]|nr:tRNA preQ1(34) S-adenosylmethionine ribosyltransferase-isomerase QueA [Pyrinomonadaceae bacterium]
MSNYSFIAAALILQPFVLPFVLMRIEDFDYELPEELIAQHPLNKRDAARMLVLDREASAWRDSQFAELPSYVRAGDVVVINNTRVFPARLVGEREPSGGRVELFLVRELGPLQWEALARPARRLREGTRMRFGQGRLRAEVVEALDDGRRLVRFECGEPLPLHTLIEELGQTPLPPYIKREAESLYEDSERYQTIYARERGAIAAPTAGLHFTPRVLDELAARGASLIEITLHVGYGTFEPVRVSDLGEHRVAPEHYEISAAAAEAINEGRARGRRILAVGTTTTRALESAVDEGGQVKPGAGLAQLTITPPYRFRVVDELLTNFHLPRSSLLVLVSTFAGRELMLAAYAHAVAEAYRFYSYGDCMLII